MKMLYLLEINKRQTLNMKKNTNLKEVFSIIKDITTFHRNQNYNPIFYQKPILGYYKSKHKVGILIPTIEFGQ